MSLTTVPLPDNTSSFTLLSMKGRVCLWRLSRARAPASCSLLLLLASRLFRIGLEYLASTNQRLVYLCIIQSEITIVLYVSTNQRIVLLWIYQSEVNILYEVTLQWTVSLFPGIQASGNQTEPTTHSLHSEEIVSKIFLKNITSILILINLSNYYKLF